MSSTPIVNKVAVLLLAFNRPEVTRQVLEAIAGYAPPRLYVALDGPRAGHPTDTKNCTAVRQLVADWETANPGCKVHNLYRDHNLGCGRAVSSGISWFFDEEEMGIVLEDDSLPNPSFFIFCETMLWKYRDTSRIMHIGGSNHLHGAVPMNSSWYFSRYPHIWGWASWRRAWSQYRFDMSELDKLLKLPYFLRYYKPEIFQLTARGQLDTWDIQWIYTFLINDGLSVLPNGNFIKNIGFDDQGGTHHNAKPAWYDDTTTVLTDLIPPASIEPNTAADDYVFRDIYSPSLLLRARRKLKKLLLK
jgi:hypothetical protein